MSASDGRGDPAGADRIVDPLTNLTSAAYLKVRMQEVYDADADPEDHALAVVQNDWPDASSWDRELLMVIVADAMPDSFGGRPAPSRLGPINAVLSCRRSRDPWTLVRRAAVLIKARSSLMPGGGTVRAWVEPLPPSYGAAVELLDSLAR